MQTIAQYLEAKGYRRGSRKGRVQGREEGFRLALRQVLVRRFKKVPPASEAKIATGDVDTLQAWLDRALTARSLKQVFTAH